MSGWRTLVFMGVILAATTAAAQEEPVPSGSPKIHRTVCALAESMTSKFPSKRMTAEQVQKTCEALVPTMSDTDRTEFMRCCSAQLLQP